MPATGKKIVFGNETQAWSLAALPPAVIQALTEAAGRTGFASLDDAIASIAAPFEMKLTAIGKAEKWRAALREPLAKQHSVNLQDLEELGLIRYRQEFGHAIKRKTWRRMFDRVVQEAGRNPNFENLSLYTDRRRGRDESRIQAPGIQDVELIEAALELWADEANPTKDEVNRLFDAAFKCLEKNGDDARARVQIIRFIRARVPKISSSRNALRMLFDSKLERWRAGDKTEAALRDHRELKTKQSTARKFADDILKIRVRAVERENLVGAYSELWMTEALSAAFRERYTDPFRVPRFVSEEIAPTLDYLVASRHGKFAAEELEPKISRDPSDCLPGDYYVADDVTWNHAFYLLDEAGRVMRGEFLLMCDYRTFYPIHGILIAGHYHSRHIRRLIWEAHDLVGLPRKGWFFENGIWGSKLIDGDKSPDRLAIAETDAGLKRLGFEIRHTRPRRPWAKGQLERSIGIIQDRMRPEPGYVGSDERRDGVESAKALIRSITAGHCDPEGKLFSMDQWAARICEKLDEWKQTPMRGKYHRGASPAQLWEEGLLKRPLRKLLDSERYILSTHCKNVRCTVSGITFSLNGETFTYYGEETAPFSGQRVLAYVNLDFPELLTFSDLKKQSFHTARRNVAPSVTATREQLAELSSRAKAHMAPLKQQARVIGIAMRQNVASTLARATQSEDVRAFGEFHNRAQAAAKAEAAELAKPLSELRAGGDFQVYDDPKRANDAKKRLAERRAARQAAERKEGL